MNMKIRVVKTATSNSKKQGCTCDWMIDEPPMVAKK
jgi:hypothetical protein